MKAGYVAVIGKTNAGKSSLINKLLGFKLNIVSSKVQTTRVNVLAVLTEEDNQIVFIDTPGIHKSKNILDKFMNKSYRSASEGADIIIYLIDGSKNFTEEEVSNIEKIANKFQNVVIVVTKIDLAKKELLAENLLKLNNITSLAIIPISSKTGENVNVLKDFIIEKLPIREFIFKEDEITNKSINFFCSEIVREKVLNFINQEIPHGVFCEVVLFKEEKNITKISIDIICEKESHKAIIIGKRGETLKRIGSSSRIDIEKLLDKKVMLNLFVKVEKDWRNKQNFISTNLYSC